MNHRAKSLSLQFSLLYRKVFSRKRFVANWIRVRYSYRD